MESIKSINAFNSAYDLFLYVYGDIKEFDLSDDEIDFLQSLNDYESFYFYLINDDTVIVTESFGDVSGNPMSFDDFWKETISYVKENA